MPVYVDSLMNHGWKLRGRITESCHLLADTDEELHAFAAKIGLKRAWAHDGSLLHYDLTPSRRVDAVRAGAVELTDHDQHRLVMRKLRLKSPKNEAGEASGT